MQNDEWRELEEQAWHPSCLMAFFDIVLLQVSSSETIMGRPSWQREPWPQARQHHTRREDLCSMGARSSRRGHRRSLTNCSACAQAILPARYSIRFASVTAFAGFWDYAFVMIILYGNTQAFVSSISLRKPSHAFPHTTPQVDTGFHLYPFEWKYVLVFSHQLWSSHGRGSLSFFPLQAILVCGLWRCF